MKRKTCSSELCIISAPPIPDLSPCIGPFKETAAILGQGFRSSLKQGFLGFGWLVFLFFRRLLYDLDMAVLQREQWSLRDMVALTSVPPLALLKSMQLSLSSSTFTAAA